LQGSRPWAKKSFKRIDPEAEAVALISGIWIGGRAADADVEKMGETGRGHFGIELIRARVHVKEGGATAVIVGRSIKSNQARKCSLGCILIHPQVRFLPPTTTILSLTKSHLLITNP
jgi:hypothetical protein